MKKKNSVTQVNNSGEGVNESMISGEWVKVATSQTGGNLHKYKYELSIPTGQNYDNIKLIWLYKQMWRFLGEKR